MSVTGHNDVRRENDFYETPAWCVRSILAHLPSANVLDPCAGSGAILNAVYADDPEAVMWGLEIDPKLATLARARGHMIETRDALSIEPWPETDVILMNPPFNLAEEFVRRALAEAAPATWVVALLRLNWLAGMKRVKLHTAHPSDVYVMPRRPSFTGKGTDSCEYAWFVWRRFAGGRWQILPPIEAK